MGTNWQDKLPQYCGVRWLFPRLMAGLYLIAFASWGWQHEGLVGEQGILPMSRLMENLHTYELREGKSLFWKYPTLFRLGSSDAFAHGLIWTCCVLAVLVIAGVWQRYLLGLLWLGYLSLVVVGDVFMGFQWDALLLEAGLLSVWLAPGKMWQGGRIRPPPRGSVFLLHWLAFRLMFLSGLVKIAGGDEVWRDMTALVYHYETQPLPHLLSWWVQQMPRGFHVGCCWIMYFIELVLPFAIFAGRWGRLMACVGFVALMAVVIATGNYTFFNLLTAALALTLLDDSWWPRVWRHRLEGAVSTEKDPSDQLDQKFRLTTAASALAVSAVLVLTLLAADSFLTGRIPGYTRLLPESWHRHVHAPVAGLRSFNAYGLFQDMTTERREIIIEVSDDGSLWLPLEFHYKPGDPTRAPRFVAPHQPRLDWQMWFAALSPGFDPQRNPASAAQLQWFGEFLSALLQQKQPVWDLLEPPPLPQKDIRHIRARLFRYAFSTPKTRRETGRWWRQERLGAFSPAFSVAP